MARGRSARLFARALARMPGGVNSPVRAFKRVGGEPFFVEHASGCRLTDVDGNEYIDFVMSWGALMLGHAHPAITAAIIDATGRGTSYGAPCAAEVELAELVVELMPSIEMVRFVNSGTEATMSAVRLARGFTRRDFILKFSGCYHGHGDSFLVQAGSGVATLGLPDSPGVPADLARLTLTLPFNDVEGVRQLFDARSDQIACVIVEPVVGNAGFIPPVAEFLTELRTQTRAHGALLIFDEVMTGFRVALGGAQAHYDIAPDLTTLGKVIGGGLPVGAYGGSRTLMEQIAPAGPIYQAGTLSGNPLAMAAGLAQLRALQQSNPYSELDGRAARFIGDFLASAEEIGVPAWGGAIGGMMGFHFRSGPVITYEQASQADNAWFAQFHRGCLERGVFLPASPYEAMFISTAHTQTDLEFALTQMRAALQEAVS
ncbi:MAG: glutamate-1-semialdehyde 2,1-aminomutase [Gemmatimonadota bacterium]